MDAMTDSPTGKTREAWAALVEADRQVPFGPLFRCLPHHWISPSWLALAVNEPERQLGSAPPPAGLSPEEALKAVAGVGGSGRAPEAGRPARQESKRGGCG